MTDIDALHTCPRRIEDFRYRPSADAANADTWSLGPYKGVCSYCGSITPEALFKAIEEGAEVTPTDKSYKIYIEGNRKFYFQHLSEEDRDRFIQLHNDHKIKLAHPGYFYVKPYFCKSAVE